MTELNPYTPTSSTSPDQLRDVEEQSSPSVPSARFVEQTLPAEALQGTTMPRYIAAIIDFVGVFVFSMLAAKQMPEGIVWLQITTVVVVGVAYYYVPEFFVGRTLGKLFTGLKVISLDGHSCTAWQIGVRTALRVIEVNPLLFGAIPAGISALMSPNRQRIGDRLVGTTVVHSRFVLVTKATQNNSRHP